MGRGGGGGGRGKSRLGGGGGTTDTFNTASTASQAKPKLTGGRAPDYAQQVAAFEAANPNLKVRPNGRVKVGSEGAPKPNTTKFTNDEAIDYLRNDVGIPDKPLFTIDGFDSARQIASVLPKGSKYIHAGEEGMGIRLPDGTVMRIQYAGGTVEQYFVGDAATYSLWKTKAGKLQIEGKEYITPATKLVAEGRMAQGAHVGEVENLVNRAKTVDSGFIDLDLHRNNYGMNAAGEFKIFDPGAVGKRGDVAVNTFARDAKGARAREIKEAAYDLGEARDQARTIERAIRMSRLYALGGR